MAMELDPLLSALADPTRRQVVHLLGRAPMRAGELAREAGMSAPAMSRHLRVLREAGVIADERHGDDGRFRVFRLRPDMLAELRNWLDQLQAAWDDQLVAYQRHVERRVR